MVGKILAALWFGFTGVSQLGIFTAPVILMGILAALACLFLIVGK
jgi:hypothetical protein